MAEFKARTPDELKNCEKPFDNHNHYQKIMRFADKSLKDELVGYIEHITARIENARIVGVYNFAVELMNSVAPDDMHNSEEIFNDAASCFDSIVCYKDSASLKDLCLKQAENARKAAAKKAEELEQQAELERQKEKTRKKFRLFGWLAVVAILLIYTFITTTTICVNIENVDATLGNCVVWMFILPIPLSIIWVKAVRAKKGFGRIIGAFWAFFGILFVLLISAAFWGALIAGILVAFSLI
ncbi:MAG: hypothetical protein II297_05855 [Clostridia bacterium]|nr:hypothetical protein [Clostridia bacterium]